MKALKLSLVIMAAALLTISLGGIAYAFHDGGVAYCDGCHTMHNSRNGVKMTKNALPIGTTNAYLLQGQDQSSTCLICHAATPAGSSYHILDPNAVLGTPPGNYTPGGDFAWVKIGYSWTLPRAGDSKAETHGHNVVAADFGINIDPRLTTAPGGTYPASSFGCHSCHDPHGQTRIIDAAGNMAKPAIGIAVLPTSGSGSTGAMPTATEAVGVYRLLAGKLYQPKSLTGNFGFANDPPVAVSPSPYNRKETSTDTRVAYGTGMSLWCANCHGGFHNDAYPTTLRHPSGMKLTSAEITNYNAYIKSGDLQGTLDTAYTSLVPFEEGTSDRTVLKGHAVNDGSQKGGADTNSTVMCVSCHRAHASAWDSAGRWNFRSTFLTADAAYPGTDAPTQEGKDLAQGRTQAEWLAGMYDRPASVFATFQRSLCNKCHAKD